MFVCHRETLALGVPPVVTTMKKKKKDSAAWQETLRLPVLLLVDHVSGVYTPETLHSIVLPILCGIYGGNPALHCPTNIVLIPRQRLWFPQYG
jgi:hypothetical protein